MTDAEFKFLARRYAEIKAEDARLHGFSPAWIICMIFHDCELIGVAPSEFAHAILTCRSR